MIPVLIGVTLIIFAILHLTPGDPAQIVLGERATEEQIAVQRELMGLNDPMIVQYGRFMGNLIFNLDMGRSWRTNRPVFDEILNRFPPTVQLAAAGTLVSVLLGIPIGIIAAIRQYSFFDNVTMVLALLGLSMPLFWMAMLMQLLFSLRLAWLPATGFGTWQHMLMPAIAIGVGSAATIARMTRSSMLEIIRQDYIRTARSKGQKESIVVLHHALRNALIPIITVIGLQFGWLLGGAVLTESVFAIPGLGTFMVEGIRTRDLPIVQGGVLIVAATFSLVNLVVDILYGFVNPRIRSQYR
jgi:peptide/nickel transport system permease protein